MQQPIEIKKPGSGYPILISTIPNGRSILISPVVGLPNPSISYTWENGENFGSEGAIDFSTE